MTHATLTQTDWDGTVERLGGADLLEAEAREAGAFKRPREVKSAVAMLQIVLAYCLGATGLRLTAAWAEGHGLASLSNVAVLYRLRNCGPWLELIVARLLSQAVPAATAPDRALDRGLRRAGPPPNTTANGTRSGGRLIRLIDATVVCKAGREAKTAGRVWRIHAAFDLPHAGRPECFSAFELTDEKEAERIDRLAVIPGEIRIADAVHCKPDGIARVLAAGGDVVVRASWQAARWLDRDGAPFNLVLALVRNTSGVIDQPVWLGRKGGEAPLGLRLVAIKMPKDKATQSVLAARREAKSEGRQIQPGTLIAAEWVILVTSLEAAAYPTARVAEFYRLRWRIEIAFKRLKSIVGLKSPPGECPQTAKAWLLAHLIAVLLTEARLSAFGDSPRLADALVPTIGAPSAF
jgi:Transposase DDE domain